MKRMNFRFFIHQNQDQRKKKNSIYFKRFDMRFGFVVNFFGKFSGFKRRKTVKATLSPPTEIRNRTTFNNFVLPLDEPRKFI